MSVWDCYIPSEVALDGDRLSQRTAIKTNLTYVCYWRSPAKLINTQHVDEPVELVW